RGGQMATSVKSIAHFRDSNRLVVRSLDTASLQRSVIEMSSLGFWESGAEPGGLRDRPTGSAEVRPVAFARRCRSWTPSDFRRVLGNAHLGDSSFLRNQKKRSGWPQARGPTLEVNCQLPVSDTSRGGIATGPVLTFCS